MSFYHIEKLLLLNIYPQYSDCPDKIYSRDEQLLETLEVQTSEPYSLYWDNLSAEDEVKSGMCFLMKMVV